jgi:hypothetical protein
MCRQKNRNLFRRLINRSHFSYLISHISYLLLREPLKIRVLGMLSAFCFLLLSLFMSCNKEEMLINRWNLQYVRLNGNPLPDSSKYHLLTRYTDYTFLYQHSFCVNTYANGQFTSSADGYYNLEKQSKLYLRFSIHNQRNEFTAKIKKLTNKELNLEYSDNGNTYFLKLYTN